MPKLRAYDQFCPIAKTLEQIGDRWTLLIVRDLLRGKQRFMDLQRSLSGIAPNLLTDRLKRLEEAGLVVRTLFKQAPPRVEYTLTDRGKALESVLSSLARFGMLNLMGAPPGRDEIDPELIFSAMPSVFMPNKAEGVTARFLITVDGDVGGDWTVQISAKGCEVARGTTGSPQVRVATDARTFALVATGRMETKEAESKGLMSISGDHDLAARFTDFFARSG